jgi:hypothetical protein
MKAGRKTSCHSKRVLADEMAGPNAPVNEDAPEAFAGDRLVTRSSSSA